MRSALAEWWRRTFYGQPPLHPIDRRLAKQWVCRRLVVIFPELRNDPRALELAYRALSLEPREGTEEGDAAVVFHLRMP
jgi:hypothetical protein